MTFTTRLLSQADLGAMGDVMASRSHMMQATKHSSAHLLKIAQARLESGARFTGVFKDDVLDGFACWYRIGQAPRADRPEASEEAGALDMMWTRKRSGREKIATGDPSFPLDDVVVGMLMIGLVTDMERNKILTFVTMVPTAFRAHYNNKLYADGEGLRRVVMIGAEAPAGGIPQGRLEDFMRSIYWGHPAEAVTYRIHTLKDEYRL